MRKAKKCAKKLFHFSLICAIIPVIKLSGSDDRMINGHFEDLNILFEFIIMHNPEYLNIYSQLQGKYQAGFNNLVTAVRKD